MKIGVCLAALVVAASGGASAMPVLTDVYQFSTDVAGNASGGQLWDTTPNGSFTIWLSVDGVPINGVAPNTNIPDVNYQLTEGTHQFEIWGQPGSTRTIAFAGMNLFFDDSEDAGISVAAAAQTDAGSQPGFFANSGLTFGPSGGTISGSGSLSFVSGDFTVTLTDYFYALPDVFGQDIATGFVRSPGSGTDFYGGFTLVVTPSPGAVGLLGVAGVVALRRRGR